MSSSASTTADLRLTSLFAHSFVTNLSHHTDDPDFIPPAAQTRPTPVLCNMDVHGCRAAGVRAIGASFVERRHQYNFPATLNTWATPMLCFIISTCARSSSHESTGRNSTALEMPAERCALN
ncbi:hypothetical protein B0H14DRAFT_3423260 [Mycena olivaceomarginata]|nr:hypothetical protein B0H14DRAFT_3423260 [Mycena olivaceomarginata]